MSKLRLPWTTLAVAAALGLGALSAPAVAAAPSALSAATGRGGAMPATARPAASSRPLLLINGDRLLVRPAAGGGAPDVLLLPGAPPGGLVATMVGDRIEEIPADLMPYLGRGLDPSLFCVSSLERAEAGGRLPVQLSYSGAPPALPGLTITRSRAGIATGYLTARSARIFGAALSRQFQAGHAGVSRARGLFGGGVRIFLAGASHQSASTPRAHLPEHTLTVTGADLAGQPDNGDVVSVFNADNLARFGEGPASDAVFSNGVAKFEVPAGHYWAVADFLDPSGSSQYLDVLPQFTVRRNTAVHLAARAASSQITMATPRPAAAQAISFTVIRSGRRGPALSASWGVLGSGGIGSLWVSPTKRRPTVGTLRAFAFGTLTSPPGHGTAYAYNLDFADRAGIITSQHYVARPSSLATVDEHYFQEAPSSGIWFTSGGFPAQLRFMDQGFGQTLRLPGPQTQYMSAGSGLLWSSAYNEFDPVNGNPWGGQSDDGFRLLRAGHRYSVDWNRFPLHPQPAVNLVRGSAAALLPAGVAASRTGNSLAFNLFPFGDNEPGHIGAGFVVGSGATVTGSYAIYQNGTKIASGNPVKGIPPVLLRPKSSVIRLVLTATRSGAAFRESPSSTTVWTWRSAHTSGARLPGGWFCRLIRVGRQFKLLRRCLVQPLLTVDYLVRGLALDGSAPAGPQLISLRAGHLRLARAAGVNRATAQVSYDDGLTWRRAAVTGSGGGSFTIAFSAPPGAEVSLRVGVTDAAGGSITETILRAYATAAA